MVWQLLKDRCYHLKNVNAIAHFTDWIVAHVHVGALGWNGFLTFGMLYWLIPRMFRTESLFKKTCKHSISGLVHLELYFMHSNVLGRFYSIINVERIYMIWSSYNIQTFWKQFYRLFRCIWFELLVELYIWLELL